MNIEIFIWYIGAGLITVCLVPQVYTTYKTKTVEGLSLFFLILQILSSICYVIYGLYEHTLPIIISNGSTILFSIILISFCLVGSPPWTSVNSEFTLASSFLLGKVAVVSRYFFLIFRYLLDSMKSLKAMYKRSLISKKQHQQEYTH